MQDIVSGGDPRWRDTRRSHCSRHSDDSVSVGYNPFHAVTALSSACYPVSVRCGQHRDILVTLPEDSYVPTVIGQDLMLGQA